jgi:hypothetical protein
MFYGLMPSKEVGFLHEIILCANYWLTLKIPPERSEDFGLGFD